jgi:hypothetical protein
MPSPMVSSERAGSGMTLGTTERSTREASTETIPEVTGQTAGRARQLAGRWMRVHLGLLLVALVLLVLAGHGQHFFYDEWAFVGGKLDSLPLPDRYLLPHNEHWTLLPLLAYKALTATVGMGSYWPYLGLLLLLHLGVTHILWRLMLVTGSKPLVATALAAVFSIVGAAAEDLLWAFQIAFVGATLFGVTAVYLAVTGTASWRKTCVLACLVLAALATSGVGIAYLVVIPLVLLRRGRRYAAGVFGLPLLVYLPWYATYGHVLTHPPNISITAPLAVFAFVVLGITAALTGYFGFGNNLIFILLVGVPVLAGLLVTRRTFLAPRTAAGRAPLAMFIGAIAFFTTVGLARAGVGTGIAASSRYIYVAMALLLPAIAIIVSGAADQHRVLARAIVPIALAIAVSNVVQLMAYAADTRQQNDASREVLVAASDLVRGSHPIFANQRPEPLLAPDLAVGDLRSGHLDAAFAGVIPDPSDRLTASLNLQIRVSPDPERGRTQTCRATPTRELTIMTSRPSTPKFSLSTAASLVLSLTRPGSPPAERTIDLAAGTYVIESLREPGNLSIQSPSPKTLLAAC